MILSQALLRPGRIDTHIYVGLPDLEERRETLARGLGFEDAACIPSALADTIAAVISSSKADAMTFADFTSVANAAALKVAKESGAHAERMLADALNIGFQRFRPSFGPDDLKYYELIYKEFEHKESKGSANGATSQKLVLR